MVAAEMTGAGAPPGGDRWKKVRAERVADLGLPSDEDEGDAIPAGVASEEPPEAAIMRLIGEGRHAEAVQMLAFALPKREAVWWACLAARGGLGRSPTPAAVACLEAAEAWVYKPIEERRQACYRAADKSRTTSPAALTALAAAWSGGSVIPPSAAGEVSAVPPEESLTARTVANAVILAAVMHDPVEAPDRFRRFLAQGQDIAQGGKGSLDGD